MVYQTLCLAVKPSLILQLATEVFSSSQIEDTVLNVTSSLFLEIIKTSGGYFKHFRKF